MIKARLPRGLFCAQMVARSRSYHPQARHRLSSFLRDENGLCPVRARFRAQVIQSVRSTAGDNDPIISYPPPEPGRVGRVRPLAPGHSCPRPRCARGYDSKTQQAGVTASSTMDKPVLHRAALVLEEWLEAVGITEGAIFRRLRNTQLAPLTHRRSSMHRRACLPGWREILWGHRLRSGCRGQQAGGPLPATMQLTEHRAVPSAIGYFHSDDAKNNTAARPPES